ncbi:M1 family aminopeptidase [Hyphobacterium sp. HN65]|uniref:M1 family aminopeptidase n=1 Tax=Hyphobacterium lacteum TaxID=3116575 RepID=A0ABU7LPV6_9PROT|nr:M1 family aminopeptidase [Hyphobacterium sp. HN65]MEE2525950.1 M1 family aminopeptidase [Hyphobacterium sp. HN65]
MRFAGIILLWIAGSALATASAQFDTPVYHYEGQLTVDTEAGEVGAEWRIGLLGEAPDSVTFLLAPTFGNIAVGGDSTGFQLAQQGPFQAVVIALAGDAREITLSYDGGLPMDMLTNDINAVSPERVELTIDSFWLPVEASFRGFLTADLRVDVGAPWPAVANGQVTQLPTGARIVNREPSLDIAFTMAPDFRIRAEEGYTLYDLRETDAGLTELNAAAAFCFDYLNGLYGAEDPLPQAHLVIHERAGSAYNRRSYITLTDISETEAGPMTQFVCHELSHHWSFGADFMTVENWLNESFAEYAGNMALRERFGEDAFLARMQRYLGQVQGRDLPPVWVEGATERGPDLVSYRAGPVALWHLETYLGRPAFAAFMTRYMVEGIDTTPDLLDTLETLEGREARDWFAAELARTDR